MNETQSLISSVLPYLGLVGVPAAIATCLSLFTLYVGREALSEKMKAAIRAEYDEKLARVQSELSTAASERLQRHKHELQLQAARDNVKFSRLHEVRAQYLLKVHGALELAFSDLQVYVQNFDFGNSDFRKEALARFEVNYHSFKEAFLPSLICLPIETANRLRQIEHKLRAVANTFTIVVAGRENGPNVMEVWTKLLNEIEGPVRQVLSEIEQDFRSLMDGSAGN